jgi:hypothetical protein
MATPPPNVDKCVGQDNYITVDVDPESGEIKQRDSPEMSAENFIEAVQDMKLHSFTKGSGNQGTSQAGEMTNRDGVKVVRYGNSNDQSQEKRDTLVVEEQYASEDEEEDIALRIPLSSSKSTYEPHYHEKTTDEGETEWQICSDTTTCSWILGSGMLEYAGYLGDGLDSETGVEVKCRSFVEDRKDTVEYGEGPRVDGQLETDEEENSVRNAMEHRSPKN